MASRFIAGDTLQEALVTVQRLNQKGIFTTLDHLGEHVYSADEARHATETYLDILETLHAAGVKSNCSLKLSQLGLQLDPGLCLSNMRAIAARGAEYGTLVRIDMEDSTTVDATLTIYQTLLSEGLTNIGLVIQAYLYRSEADVEQLLSNGTRIRLCKGAYKEPGNVAFPKKSDVDANYDRLTGMMIDAAIARGSEASSADGRIPAITAVATHDESRIDFACDYAQHKGLTKEALEFQMLNGIRSDLQDKLAQAGYPMRVYVPYGTEWYPYFMRRLAERPANLWFFLSALFRG
ncbi:MAG: proline dehydrogenase [Anaerolineales bacterium]|nr:MAG: proline dehydrogenase [Anaerolineales bacterium]